MCKTNKHPVCPSVRIKRIRHAHCTRPCPLHQLAVVPTSLGARPAIPLPSPPPRILDLCPSSGSTLRHSVSLPAAHETTRRERRRRLVAVSRAFFFSGPGGGKQEVASLMTSEARQPFGGGLGPGDGYRSLLGGGGACFLQVFCSVCSSSPAKTPRNSNTQRVDSTPIPLILSGQPPIY